MKKIAYFASTAITLVAMVFAVTNSALWINKPEAPKELLK